jgi:hypothetical protein
MKIETKIIKKIISKKPGILLSVYPKVFTIVESTTIKILIEIDNNMANALKLRLLINSFTNLFTQYFIETKYLGQDIFIYDYRFWVLTQLI